MKKVLSALMLTLSFQAAAVDFTSVTLNNETTLRLNPSSQKLYYSLALADKSDLCSITIESNRKGEEAVIPAGTVFELLSIMKDDCHYDKGRQCELEILARNYDRNIDLYLECSDKGLFAKKIKSSKINKIAKNIITTR